jgi:hypothetical protein
VPCPLSGSQVFVCRLSQDCYRENAHPMSAFDPDLMPPPLVPAVADLAVWGLRLRDRRRPQLRRPACDARRAIRIANDAVYDLAASVQSGDLAHARRMAAEIRTGKVHVNYPARDAAACLVATSSPPTGAKAANGRWTSSSNSRLSLTMKRTGFC